MKLMQLIIALLFVVGCATNTYNSNNSMSNKPTKYDTLLQQAYESLQNRQPQNAIDSYLNPIINHFETNIKKENTLYYSARSPEESLMYALMAINKKKKGDVLLQVWAQAYYFKGFALLELGEVDRATSFIKIALKMSPYNATYIAELGHISQLSKQWEDALKIYEKALESAESFSPKISKTEEIIMSLHGIGYSYIELDRLDEAISIYKKCLKLNKKDARSHQELKYIKQLKESKK